MPHLPFPERMDGFEPINMDDFSVDPADLAHLSRVYGLYAAYAEHKANAMRYRFAGDMEAAEAHEKCCEGVYKRLPQWARW